MKKKKSDVYVEVQCNNQVGVGNCKRYEMMEDNDICPCCGENVHESNLFTNMHRVSIWPVGEVSE